jgi:hypothetical protein
VKNFLKSSLCASLDVLGFQDEIKRAYAEKREVKLLREIEETIKSAADDLEDMAARNPQILTCELIADFQLNMACRGLFIRGGVSVGTLASDERIVFGDCLIRAHELEVKSARNPRVVLDSCFSNQNGVDLEMSTFRLMRDVDGYLFVNYLSALISPSKRLPHPGLLPTEKENRPPSP